MFSTDVVLIGAGPIGIELAVALKRAGLDYVHLEARQIGHTMTWWAPGTRWFSSNDRISIAGVPLHTLDHGKATREEYLRYLRSIVEQFDLSIRTYEPVTAVRADDGEFLVHTATRTHPHTYRARRVILATGGTARPRRLDIPGAELSHVSHFMHEPHLYFRQRVLVVGGKNSAVESALRLHHAGARVGLSYRGAELPAKTIKYWLYPEIAGLIKARVITPYFSTVPTQITASAVTLHSHATREDIEVPADFVLLQIGYVADMTLARMGGVELREPAETPAFDPKTMETNVKGLYVAGTAIAGSQDRFAVFLENCHVHVGRIVAALTGRDPPREVKSLLPSEV
ncbi:MAG: NAD(P)-binding domain-containing protein [Tepidisphaerales bacterium]